MAERYIIKSIKWSTKDRVLYWGPNQNGYTDMIAEAGIYTKEEADKIVRLSGNSKKSVEPLLLTESLIKKGERQCKVVHRNLEEQLINEAERYASFVSDIKKQKQTNVERQAVLESFRAMLAE